MKFGLEEKDWQIVERLLIEPLKKQGAQIWIFGSRARGDHRPFSDLDVLYFVATDLPAGFISSIVENLEESRLPIKVDLVFLEDLAESYRENVFRDRIFVS